MRCCRVGGAERRRCRRCRLSFRARSTPPAAAEYVGKEDVQTRIGAVLGLGIAYAGRCAGAARRAGRRGGWEVWGWGSSEAWVLLAGPRPMPLATCSVLTPITQITLPASACREKEEVAELLLPLVLDGEAPMEVAATAALALGLVYQGTANGDAVEAVLQVSWVGWKAVGNAWDGQWLGAGGWVRTAGAAAPRPPRPLAHARLPTPASSPPNQPRRR